MALILENKICNACGADVRPNALFCYSCGGAVTESEKSVVLEDTKKSSKNVAAEDPIRQDEQVPVEKLSENKAAETIETAEKIEATEENKLTEKAEATEKIETTEKTETTETTEKVELKSAAALRRKSKSVQNKKIEVVWEEPETAPNVWFISVAIVLSIIAGVILFLAVRLR